MNSNGYSVKTTQGEMLDMFDLCERMNMSPRAVEESLLKTMEEHGYDFNTDVGRMVTTLRAFRSKTYRMNVAEFMKSNSL